MTIDYSLRSLHVGCNSDAVALLKGVGVDPYGIDAMLPKMMHVNILIEGLECRVANIIKQEMLSVGGDAAVARESVACTIERTDVILMGTTKQMGRFAEKISHQPFGLRRISTDLKELLAAASLETIVLNTSRREMIFGKKTHVMGILNVTPDSFSDGGLYLTPDRAVDRGLRLVEEGADILDIGGESTRPGSESVSNDEERKRVIPVIKRLAGKIDIPISIDTTKAEIAREALDAGAEIVNDISAMSFDPSMAGIVANSRAAVILQHMRGTPKTMQEGDLTYSSLLGQVLRHLREKMSQAISLGVHKDQMVVDPGLGFGKKPEDSLKLIKHLSEFRALGRPILVGPSRKYFVAWAAGRRKEVPDPQHRMEGTMAAVVAAIVKGAHIVRVHDVSVMKKASAVADAILQA